MCGLINREGGGRVIPLALTSQPRVLALMLSRMRLRVVRPSSVHLGSTAERGVVGGHQGEERGIRRPYPVCNEKMDQVLSSALS
eukprot:2650095-Rhodomonas_salina.4